MDQLRDVLTMQSIDDAKENLKRLLQRFADTPDIPRLEGDLGPDDPVLLLVAQARCERICRAGLFCPFQGCRKQLKSNADLLTNLNKKHDLEDRCCRDLMHHFLNRLCPANVYIVLRTHGSETVDRHWDVERRPLPDCGYFQKDMSVSRNTLEDTKFYPQISYLWDGSGDHSGQCYERNRIPLLQTHLEEARYSGAEDPIVGSYLRMSETRTTTVITNMGEQLGAIPSDRHESYFNPLNLEGERE
jgi:hypothetical protein